MANTSEEETKVYFTYSSGEPCTSTPAHAATTYPGQLMSAPVHLSTRDRVKWIKNGCQPLLKNISSIVLCVCLNFSVLFIVMKTILEDINSILRGLVAY